jgi:ribose 5-phosphate isomerase B
MINETMTRSLIIALGADHGGVGLKNRLAAVLIEGGHQVLDFGTDGSSSVDYPDFARAVCRAIIEKQAELGILVCGTGIGMSIAANRYPEIRCGLAHDVTTARLTRAHNDANVLALGARIVGEEVALDILGAFLSTPYEGGRHDRRIAKLTPDALNPNL